MRTTITIIFSFLLSAVFAQAPSWQWAKAIEGNADEAGIYDLVQGNLGNIYVAGSQKSGSSTFGISTLINQGCFIAKMDASGGWDWATKVGTNYGNRSISLSAAPNGDVFFVTFATLGEQFGPLTVQDTFTSSTNRLIVGKITSSGSFAWIKSAAVEQDAGYCSIAVDSNNVSYVTCRINGQSQFDNISFNSTQAAIAKLDNQGHWLWAKPYSGGYYDRIKVASSGKIFIAGESYDLATYDTLTFHGFGGDDAFVGQMDENGNWLWIKSAGGISTDRCYDIAINNSDEIFLTGYYRESATFGSSTFNSPGNTGLFVSKLNSSGNWLWTKSINGTGNLIGNSIATDMVGNAYLVGSFEQSETFGSTSLTSYGQSDIFISKIDNQGNFLWTSKAGSIQDDMASALLLANEELYVGCNADGDATFGSISVPFANTTGVDIGKLSASVGIKDYLNDNNLIKVYPNPGKGEFMVQSLKGNVRNFQMFNSLGAIVTEGNVGGNLFQIDLTNFGPGLYIIKLNGEYFETISKIIKE